MTYIEERVEKGGKGGFANKVLTTWITTSLMAIILTIVASQLVRKALTPSTLKAFDDRHLPFPQRGDAPPHISNFARQQHGHGVGGHSSHSMNGSLRQQSLHKGADSVTIPIQLHGPGAALSSFPHTEGWMPMEPISEASSVHYGTAYSGNTLDHEHSGGLGEEQHGEGSGGGELHGRRHIKAPEMKGGEGGVPRYKLAVEDGLGLHLKKNHGRRSTDQDKLLEQGHALAGVHDPLDRQDKGENEGAETQQQEGFRLPWGRLSWLGGLSLWVAFSQLIANKYVECGSLAYWLAILSVIPAAMFVLLHTRTRVLKEHKRHAFLPREPSHRPRDSVVGQVRMPTALLIGSDLFT
ncbi:hypothetical protein DUNSADRAFT_11906 [Dunaliella salina]|uniref:Uncharacterized protein n=1 Tax=Dunaliella salina TaxID=3046 RepID=A0ABQ7H4B9_DUNSA|nr:hypothetical protein DUNSADRAFT_11906 [Dunaliella salina]|eukprot:KAF5841699.1 hypothetical protein DUNSADRAFT_11906 [Dunaliella salina]